MAQFGRYYIVHKQDVRITRSAEKHSPLGLWSKSQSNFSKVGERVDLRLSSDYFCGGSSGWIQF